MSTSQCDACGAEVVSAAVFCHQCGARVGSSESAPESSAASAESSDASETAIAEDQDTRQAPREEHRDPRDMLRRPQSDMGERHISAEEPLWKGCYSAKAMYPAWVVGGFATVAALVIGIVFGMAGFGWTIMLSVIVIGWAIGLGKLFYHRLNVKYELTTKRFMMETGILRRTTDRMEVIDIDDVSFVQGVIDRLTGVGTIEVTSSDRSHPKIQIRGIEKVKEVADMVDQARRDEREKRGLHIEAI